MKRHFSDTLLNFFLRFFYSKAYVSALIAATSNDPGKKMFFWRKKAKGVRWCLCVTLSFFFSFFLPFYIFLNYFSASWRTKWFEASNIRPLLSDKHKYCIFCYAILSLRFGRVSFFRVSFGVRRIWVRPNKNDVIMSALHAA